LIKLSFFRAVMELKITFYPILVLVFCAIGLSAQRDTSLLLTPERLNENDVLDLYRLSSKQVVSSATRSPELATALPYSTWVITGDDIVRYGFVTLGDVLKAAPGIRVSQPGNALEGETFQMAGVSGNQYVKFLINGVPVKPIIALGMPIGAQLPIRQAERIEVIYGPMGVMYGNEACAGVVNIVLKETERPIFTQADLGFGQFGYTSLDLTFGGKLFKDKNLLRFSLYGSSTTRDSYDVYDDASVNYDYNTYLPNGHPPELYLDNDAYTGYYAEPSSPTLAPVSHESRLFGGQVEWRGLKFNYNLMKREDASWLGFNPLSVSPSFSGNLYKDRIENFALSYNRNWNRLIWNNTLSTTSYRVGNNSKVNHIVGRPRYLAYRGYYQDRLVDTLVAALLSQDLFTQDARNNFSRSFDSRLESVIIARVVDKFWLTAGATTTAFWGLPLNSYAKGDYDDIIRDSPLNFSTYDDLEFRPFVQADWRGKHLRLIAGIDQSLTLNFQNTRSYNVAALYQFNERHALFANVGRGNKSVHAGLEALNYLRVANNSIVLNVDQGSGGSGSVASNTIPEYFNRYELGFRHQGMTQLSVFYNTVENRRVYWQSLPIDGGDLFSGYLPLPGVSLRQLGAQLRFVTENAEDLKQEKGSRSDRLVRWRGEYYLQYVRGTDQQFNGTYSEILNQPRWINQLRSSGRSGKFQVTVAYFRQSSVLSKSVVYRDGWGRPVQKDRYPRFQTWDMMTRFYLNKNFVIYFHLINMFNRYSWGLDAFGNPDDLLEPIQPGRQYRFGINYGMN
jgi:TonB-dependent Receptor Plug Domain